VAYEIQYAKIATTSKLPDRFLNCQSKETQSLDKAYMGQVFTLVEIISPWFTTAQVGQTIINTFSQNYYRGSSTSDLSNFEEALKKVNESLAQVTQNGETNWIGNLNAILAVVIENKIHLAQTGKAEVYIFRDGKTENITYGLSENQIEPHPLKTFSNITSGELKVHDKVLIANPEIFRHLDTEAIQQIVTLCNPDEAVLQIAKMLKRKKIKAVNLLILNLATPEEISKLPISNLSNTVYLDKPIETVSAYLSKFWQHILQPFLKFVGQGAKAAGSHTATFTKKYIENVKEKRAAANPVIDDSFQKEFMADKHGSEDGLLKDEQINYSPDLNVHYYERAKELEKNKAGKFMNKFFDILGLVFGKTKEFLKDKHKRPYLLVVLAVILIFVIFTTVRGNKGNNSVKLNLLQAQTILREAEDANKQGKTAILSNNQEQGKQLLATSIDKAEQILSNEVVKGNAQLVIESSLTELDKLTGTTRFSSLSPIIESKKDAKAIFVLSGQVYLLTKDEIYKGNLVGDNLEKVGTLARNNGDFLTGTTDSKNIYLYTSSQKVYLFNTLTDKLELAKLDDTKWETANAISYYMGNLYLLDGILGQIYKHTNNNDTFAKGEAYVQLASIDVKNTSSFAIDGSVFLLKNNGEVLELQKGKLKDFSLRDIPTPWSKIEKPAKIYTDGDTSSIYILDSGQKRILEFDKDGDFTHQYALPDSFNEIKDFAVSSKSKKIWVLNAGNLYEIGI